jgi:hypothetical protein
MGAIKQKRRRRGMKSKRAELKAKLMAQAEAEIETFLDWHERTQEPTLSEIEEVVLAIRGRLSEGLALRVIEEQERRQPVPGPACPECGREMSSKGEKKTTVETWVGVLRLGRGYYHCSTCKVGLFPPG